MKKRTLLTAICGLILSLFISACGDSTIYYQIENKKSGHYLSSDGSTGLVQKSAPGDSGLWELVEAEGGFHQIRNKESQLHISTMGSQIKEPLKQTDTSGEDSLWQKVTFEGDLIGFKNKDSDRYINTGGALGENTPIMQTSNTATTSSIPGDGAQWKLIEQE